MTPQEAAVRCLLGYRVDRYPADPKAILNAIGYPTHGYASMAAHSMVSVEEIVETISSRDAAILEGRDLQGKPVHQVVYNDLWQDRSRVRHMLAHELGHICLGHETRAQNEPADPLQEEAAEAFARCFCCPPSVFAAMPAAMNPGLIMAAFGMNEKQLRLRREALQEDLTAVPQEMNAQLLKRAKAWLHSRECTRCGALWRIKRENEHSCPVCGGTIRWHYTDIAPEQPVRYLNEE